MARRRRSRSRKSRGRKRRSRSRKRKSRGRKSRGRKRRSRSRKRKSRGRKRRSRSRKRKSRGRAGYVTFTTKDGERVSFKKKRKRRKGKTNPALRKWVKAAQKHGYMVKGSHKKMPKRGTKAHAAIKRTYNKMR